MGLFARSEYEWDDWDDWRQSPTNREPAGYGDFDIKEFKRDLEAEAAKVPTMKEILNPPAKPVFREGSMEKWIHALSHRLTVEREENARLRQENADLRARMDRVVKTLGGEED